MTKELATYLVLAQAGSDIGKNIETLFVELSDALKKEAQYGYWCKDINIRKAINIIAKHHPQDTHFFVVEDKDKVSKYIVYFEYTLKDGVKYQISFHSFDDKLKRYTKNNNKSYTQWTGLCESREDAQILVDLYRLNKNHKGGDAT